MRTECRILPSVPLFPLLAAFVAGELLAAFFQNQILLVCLLPGMVVALGVFARRWETVLWGFFTGIGAVSMMIVQPWGYVGYGGEAQLEGTVCDVTHMAYGQRFVMELDGGVNRGALVLVSYRADIPVVAIGDTVSFGGVAERVDEGVCVPGEFTWESYAFRNGISALCTAAAGSLSVRKGSLSLAGLMEQWRMRFSDFVYYRSGLSPQAAVMLDAVLAGNADAISASEREAFAKAGVAHVLALSGTHVAVMAFMVSLIFFPLVMAGHRKIGVVGILCVLWIYVAFTGCSPSVVRTVIMASVVMLARIFRRSASPLNSLCLAALVILLYDPRALFAPGFQLSFAAVAGILMFALELRMFHSRIPVGLRWLCGWMAVCVSAVVATAPVAAWHFHQMPLCFLLANLPVGMVLPWFMGGGMVLLVMQAAGIPAGWLIDLLEWCYGVMAGVSGWVSSLPVSAVEHMYFPWWILIPYYLGLWAVWLAIKKRRSVFALAGGLFIAFGACCYVLSRPCYPAVEAYGMRNGYAATILLREGERVWVLTDAPAKFHDDMREGMMRRLRGFLDRRGVDSLIVADRIDDAAAFYADSTYWVIAGKCMAVVTDPDMKFDATPDYVLVGRRFKGSLTDLACRVRPTCGFVVSPSVFPRRRERFIQELDSMKMPYASSFEGFRLSAE